MRVIGYARVSTEEQAVSGAGLEAQRRAIRRECKARGWQLSALLEDAGRSGAALATRPGLNSALDLLESKQADLLMVSKVDRLSRSLQDFAGLMERSRQRGWGVVALDIGVNTASPSGEMLANVLAVFAQFERRLIGQRTKEALAVRRAEGVRLGRPSGVDRQTFYRIVDATTKGLSLAEVARDLNRRKVPTAQGGAAWHASTVSYVLKRAGQANSRPD